MPQPTSPILQYFTAAHLPEGPLREMSEAVAELAHAVEAACPPSPEKSAGLRHLLEAKDCFVRALLPQAPVVKP